MKDIFTKIGLVILTSLYYFPFNSVWLPSVNTKMALAALAIPLFIILGAGARSNKVEKGLVGLYVVGFLVTVIGIMSVIINNTGDYTYASYFVSMCVWLGGAYVVTKAMHFAYGKVTVRVVGNFLIAVCVSQCIIAQLINSNAAIASVVDSFMVSTGFMGKHETRLYGIGCALDVAGLRFCAVLLMTTVLSVTPVSKERRNVETLLYVVSYLIIAIFGSMIARTTSIGVVLSMVLLIYYRCSHNDEESRLNVRNLIKTFVLVLLITIPAIILFYQISPEFKENLRFGFEGFFSLAEQGEWDVRSNRQLASMMVWPDNLKTWLIGDGYFEVPQNDYYYTGPMYDYYMGTDVGYCRFIFYFGTLGLLAFSSVFIASAIVCSRKFPKYSAAFWGIAIMNFVGWIKVSSDIFLIFALFLCIPKDNNGEYEDSIPDSLDI